MSFDLGRASEKLGRDEGARRRNIAPSPSLSFNSSMSGSKPQPASQQRHRHATGNSASRENQKATNRLSKQKPVASGFLKDRFASPNDFSPYGTSRHSHVYLAGSQGCLLLDQAQQEHETSPTEAGLLDSKRLEHGSLAKRRNKSELQLASPTLSRRSKSSVSLVGKRQNIFDFESAPRVPRRQSTAEGAFSTSSLSSLQSVSRHSTDNGSRQKELGEPGFVKLDILPVSPLNPHFLDEYQSSPPANSVKHDVLETTSADGTSQSRSSLERAGSVVGDSGPSMPCIPMRRRSLIRTPGLATRPPPSDKVPCLPNISQPSASIASVLSGARVSKKRSSEDKGKSALDQRSTQTHLPLPSLPKMMEQERPITPCESDYQQLGAIKFGTLRITNASPAPSYSLDSDEEEEPTKPTSTRVTNDANYQTGSPRHGPHGASNLRVGSTVRSGTISNVENKIKRQDNTKFSFPVTSNSELNRSWTSGEKLNPESIENHLANLGEVGGPQDSILPGASSPRSHPTREPSYSQGKVEIAPPSEEGDAEYSRNEVLDVRDDPSAKPTREWSESKRTTQAIQKALSSSDSGIASANSSLSSRRTLSNADSAYSSNASIESSPPGSGAVAADKSTLRGVSTQEPQARKRHTDENHNQTGDGHLKDATRGSLLSMSRSSIRRLSSRFRPRHSRSFSSISESHAVHEQSSNEAFPSKDTPRSGDADVRQDTARPGADGNSNSHKPGRLQWFSVPHKKNSFTTSFAAHDIQTVPSIPMDVEERLRQHSRAFPTTSMRLTKKSTRSEESLKTIISVESKEESNYDQHDDGVYDERTYNDSSINDRRSHKTFSNLNSTNSVQRLGSARTIKSITSSSAARGNTNVQGMNVTKNFQIEALPFESHEDREGDSDSQRLASLASTSGEKVYAIRRKPVPSKRELPPQDKVSTARQVAYPKAQYGTETVAQKDVLAMSRNQNTRTTYGERKRGVFEPSQDQGASNLRAYKGKAPVSAPNLLSSSSSTSRIVTKSENDLHTPEVNENLPPEPPPRSILRSSFSKGPRQQSRPEQHSSQLNKNNQESMKRHPLHSNHARSQSTSALSQGQTTASQDDLAALPMTRRHSTLLHRPAFSEPWAAASSAQPRDGSKPPYRVLHSYNSPAYKNTPIWG